MHTTKDYSKSPAKAFDAVEDVKNWIGRERWDEVSKLMATVRNPYTFSLYAELAGVKGFPVNAWYELYHGEGSFAAALDSEEYKPVEA